MPARRGAPSNNPAGRPKGTDGAKWTSVETRERLIAAQADKEEAKAKLAEIELRQKRGEIVEWAAVQKNVRRDGMAFRDAMLSVPGRIAAEIAGLEDEREIERRLTNMIREELTRVADGAGI